MFAVLPCQYIVCLQEAAIVHPVALRVSTERKDGRVRAYSGRANSMLTNIVLYTMGTYPDMLSPCTSWTQRGP